MLLLMEIGSRQNLDDKIKICTLKFFFVFVFIFGFDNKNSDGS